MGNLLADLLIDLRRRTDAILAELSRLDPSDCPTAIRHKIQVSQEIQRSGEYLKNMLEDPDLLNPILEPNHFIEFKRLSEQISNTEESSLLLLKRYDDDDRFLSALMRLICHEVGYKDNPPLCGGLSFQYFQALVDMDIVLAPQRQCDEILSLPDIYHELAHFVVFRNRKTLDFPIHALIEVHFSETLRKAKQRGVPEASIRQIREYAEFWADRWRVEIVCDLIATYWCGPAYGWANLLLSATRGEPFEDAPSHPSDDSRRMGIDCMLKLINEGPAVELINGGWEDLRRLSSTPPEPGYAKRYPIALIEKLADFVFEACGNLGFRSYIQQKREDREAISCLLTDAWAFFRKNAGGFSQYKSGVLERLRGKVSRSAPQPAET